MGKKTSNTSIESCMIVFLACSMARMFEYFLIRTDETILAEAFLHKVFGIIVLAVMLRAAKLSWGAIGFGKTSVTQDTLKGFALGAACFSVAYLIECILLYSRNGNVQISIYASGFSLNGEAIKQDGILFIVLCIAFNIINVWMEEGIFRGLFSHLLADKLDFKGSTALIALLFGIWHWVMPLRDFAEGRTSIANLLIVGMGYIVLAGIMSIKWSILYKITGSLWMGLGEHFFNNVIATNLLHVISEKESDSMQIVRILIGQLLSFILVIMYYKSHRNSTSWSGKEVSV